MVSLSIVLNRTRQVTLSAPLQAVLMTSLCGLTLWTILFSSYPPVHNTLHHLRHETLGVACH